jgi:hypothetical protein
MAPRVTDGSGSSTRAQELLHMEKEIQNAKKLVDTERIEEPT